MRVTSLIIVLVATATAACDPGAPEAAGPSHGIDADAMDHLSTQIERPATADAPKMHGTSASAADAQVRADSPAGHSADNPGYELLIGETVGWLDCGEGRAQELVIDPEWAGPEYEAIVVHGVRIEELVIRGTDLGMMEALVDPYLMVPQSQGCDEEQAEDIDPGAAAGLCAELRGEAPAGPAQFDARLAEVMTMTAAQVAEARATSTMDGAEVANRMMDAITWVDGPAGSATVGEFQACRLEVDVPVVD